MICVHNVPMLCVEWEGLGIILQPICEALKIQLNRPNLVCHLGAAARKIRTEISSIVKGKLVSLKIDSATRLGRHILGVNIQLYDVEQKDIAIYTIGMVELNTRHTGKYVKTKILEILAMYKIFLTQIFTVTCENGVNMIATVNQLRSELQESYDHPEDDDTFVVPIEQVDWMETVEKEFCLTITLVRCAVHTMQLSVADVIRPFDAEIRKCTSVSNNCRKIAYKSVFKDESLPPLYSKTRWGGVFEMLNYFNKHEKLFNELGLQHSELDLTEQWQFIKEYIAAFEPVYIATKKMQAKHTPLNEFYLTWMTTVIKINAIQENRFTQALTQALKKRLEILKENIVFKAA
uniref:Uncharacterized protein n=1 Tax=Anopheles quadriannulatus TaxID=34691 RepID=A0A182X8I9_ANOQN